MSKQRIPQRFKPGETLSAAKLNDLLRTLANIEQAGNLAQGIATLGALAPALGGIVEGPFIGKIVAPVGAETVFTDERYWITSAYCSLAAGDHETELTFGLHPDTTLSAYIHCTASNLVEFAAAPPTHLVAVDTYVEVFRLRDMQATPVPHYVFSHTVPYTGGVTTIDINGDTRSGALGVDERVGPIIAGWRGAVGVDDVIEVGWEPNAEVNMQGQIVGNVDTPVDADHAVNKGFCDAKDHLPDGAEDDLAVCPGDHGDWVALTGFDSPGQLATYMGGAGWEVGGEIAAGSTDNLRVLGWDFTAGTIQWYDIADI